MHLYFFVFIFTLLFLLVHCVPINKEDGMNYLMSYGYLSNDTTKNTDFENALRDFQTTFSLPVTGKLDDETAKQMELPRCGKPDRSPIKNKRYIWNKSKLTYKFKNYPINKEISRNNAKKEISKAFNIWAKHIPVTFEEKPEGQVDIDIYFYPAKEGDGPGKTLAYAYFPKIGDMYFDAEKWTVESRTGFNLFTVAAHEIGHSLGLEHSEHKQALLYPYIKPYNPNWKLHLDDITRIQDLYGKKITNVCDLDSIDSVFYSTKASSVFLIKNNQVWKIKNKKLQTDYPKEVTTEWPNSPSYIEAMFYYKGNNFAIKNSEIWKFDGRMKKTSFDFKVADVDAAVVAGNRFYVYKGSQYWKYDISSAEIKLKSGFPKSISSYWTAVPSSVDGVYFDQDQFFYFFKGSTVYKFNMNNKRMQTMMSLKEWLSC